MRLNELFILIFVLNFGISNAQNDHLEPINETFNSNSDFLNNSLFKDLSQSPRFRVTVFPSFDSNYVLSLEKNKENGKKYLIYQILIEHNYTFEKFDIKKYSQEISNETEDLLFNLFLRAISNTKYGEMEMPGNDGTDYFFTINDIQSRSGKTWSPEYNSKMGKLISIVKEITNTLKVKDRNTLILSKELVERIKKLTTELE